jgi:hypothetical protein
MIAAGNETNLLLDTSTRTLAAGWAYRPQEGVYVLVVFKFD